MKAIDSISSYFLTPCLFFLISILTFGAISSDAALCCPFHNSISTTSASSASGASSGMIFTSHDHWFWCSKHQNFLTIFLKNTM